MNRIHPNDRVRSLAASIAQGEDQTVTEDLRAILAEARQDACTIEGTLLAGRQPVAQKPVGWWLEDANGVGYFSRKMQPAALYAHRTTPGYSATPLHAAAPAHGIDREQQRPLIARSLAEWHEDDGNVMWWAWCGRDWAGELVEEARAAMSFRPDYKLPNSKRGAMHMLGNAVCPTVEREVILALKAAA